MTKTFKVYLIIWTICFMIFNAVTFISPLRVNAIIGNFWTGYIFIILAFLGQLLCSYIAFKEENIQKMFYNISLVLISYISFIVLFIVGMTCMITPILPISIGIVISMIISGIFAVLVVITCFVIKVVSDMDDEIDVKTFAIKNLTANAEQLMMKTTSTEMNEVCRKVYESFKYSNIMSDNSLKELNEQIQREFTSFENAVNENDKEMASSISMELIALINKRNIQCKLIK